MYTVPYISEERLFLHSLLLYLYVYIYIYVYIMHHDTDPCSMYDIYISLIFDIYIIQIYS